MGQIYKVTDLTNNFIYIGKTTKNINERKKDHLSKARRKVNNIRFHNAIRAHGQDNFTWSVIEECSNDLLNEREMYYISKLKSNNKKFGYNMTEGGDNDPKVNLGRKRSKETCLKISLAFKGRKFTKEQKKTMGKAQSERWKKDPAMRAKFRKVQQNNRKPIKQYTLSGNFLKYWASAAEASISLAVDSSNINRACNRHMKTCKGFFWRFQDDVVTFVDLLELNKPKRTKEASAKSAKALSKEIIQYTDDNIYI